MSSGKPETSESRRYSTFKAIETAREETVKAAGVDNINELMARRALPPATGQSEEDNK